MGNVLFKVKFNNPNAKNKSPKLNKNHLLYIAKRPNSIHNYGKAYSLFGSIKSLGYEKFGDINNLKKVSEYIYDKSKDKTTVYKAVISLQEEDAIKRGYQNREEWEKLIKTKIKDIAYNYDIPIERMEYVTAFHLEKGHPHIHVMFWDSAQENYRGRIALPKIKNINKALDKYVFEDVLSTLYKQEQEVKIKAKEQIADILSQLEDDYERELSKPTIQEFKLPHLNINGKSKKELMKDFGELVDLVSKTGSFKYAYMSEEYKRKLDEFSENIIASNFDLRTLYNQYEGAVSELKKYGIEKGDGSDEFKKLLGNQILKTIKKVKVKQSEDEKISNKKTDAYLYGSRALSDIILDFSRILYIEKRNNLNHIVQIRELNSQAKKEYAIKMRYKSSIDWKEFDEEI